MSTKNIIEGLQILIKYMNNKECSHVYAKYEELFFEETDNPISNTDLKKLLKLGWSQEIDGEYDSPDEDDLIDEDDNFDIGFYNPSSRWCCYASY